MVSVAGALGWGAASRQPGLKSDEINALPGDDAWYCHIAPRPHAGLPLRARVFHPGGWATFDSPDDAANYLDHPTGTAEAAREYIAWTAENNEREEKG